MSPGLMRGGRRTFRVACLWAIRSCSPAGLGLVAVLGRCGIVAPLYYFDRKVGLIGDDLERMAEKRAVIPRQTRSPTKPLLLRDGELRLPIKRRRRLQSVHQSLRDQDAPDGDPLAPVRLDMV